ncbi:MAG: hypothetical protein QGG74_05530 [Phycisphaerales bacterium]|jgi:hypothetical protein|nr:hypothetical protein [Phycisphaerales bacterium]MDP6987487.1 hypothetical protein [Phycisphaerales bacterium]
MRSLLFILLCASAAKADSGLIRLSETAPPWRITIMTDPTPIREGLADISVLVQDEATGEAILDAGVELGMINQTHSLTLSVPATRAQADNRLLYSAKFVLPAAGQWNVTTTIRRGEYSQSVPWQFTASPPLPPLAAIWPWLLPAVAAIALYAANQRLRRSRGAVPA